ncbi:hypothetical protein [Streptomyces sp. NRRL B-1322]|uniref:hypothetical protein n=1 Tax=Streptomyces sp. NRRL B-1322 TaxID=1463828 RepID=UPI000A43084E|nr:hypothetical protein [Streptomyces sp. NRRL B-1322]
MNEEEDMRLAGMTPEISRRTLVMLRGLAGLEPPEQVPEEAMVVADAVLAQYGTDGLRVLVMTLAAWATAQIENVAELSGRRREPTWCVGDRRERREARCRASRPRRDPKDTA